MSDGTMSDSGGMPLNAPHSTPQTTTRTPFEVVSGFLGRLLWALVTLAFPGVLVGYFATSWWVFETYSGFRVQFALIMGLGILLGLKQRRPVVVGVLILASIVNVTHVLPYLVSDQPATAIVASPAAKVKVLTVNVHTANDRFDLVRAAVASHAPDIVLFTEMNDLWLTEMKSLTAGYPYTVARTRSDNFGIVLFSRIQPQKLEIIDFLAGEVPSIEMVFPLGSRTVTLIGTHPLPPRTYEYSAIRNAQLVLIARYLAKVTGPKIVMGDMNTVPWSPYFRDLLRDGGLKDTGLGRGVVVTWPSHAWWLFGIPLDHILVSPDVSVISRSVGPWVGSDHYPVVAEIAIP